MPLRAAHSSHAEYAARIQTVVRYVDQHLDEKLPLSVLARVACFSPFHFHRIFTAMVGETPAEFIERLRLEKAANMLRVHPRSTITGVALDAGFSSPAVFSRAFRTRFNVTASEWRRAPRAFPEAASRKSKKCKASAVSFGYLQSGQHVGKRKGRRRGPLRVRIRLMPALHVAYAACLAGYHAATIGDAWERIARWAGPHGFLGPRATMVGLSFDNPDITPNDRCRYYACLVAPRGIALARGIGEMDIPGGRHAVLSFRGSTADIRDAYAAFYGEWLAESGEEPADAPAYEIYFGPPDLRRMLSMDICMPLRT